MEKSAGNRAVDLEENRLRKAEDKEVSYLVHERHRAFPEVFENRRHGRIIDISAGIGLVAKRIRDSYDAELICNELSPTCLNALAALGLKTVSFDCDDPSRDFPFESAGFDAVICLATIEHLIHIDHMISQVRRILKDGAFLYLSAPNYSGLAYLLPFLLTGRTFHDPLGKDSRYEFYAHVRYFTYRTLKEYVESLGFTLDSVYLPTPKSSTKYLSMRERSYSKAALFRMGMKTIYTLFSPRWAAEPILCFRNESASLRKVRKVVM